MLKHLQNFIHFAAKELGLKTLPKISFVGSSENSKSAFGHFLGTRSASISVRVTERHPIDIMRTLAHELIHYKQKVNGTSQSEKMKEDEANALAGRIMRKYDTQYPSSFSLKPVMEDGGVAANAMGDSSPSNPDSKIAQPERLLGKPLNKIIKRKSLKEIKENTMFHKKALFADAGVKRKPMNDRFSGKTDYNAMQKSEEGEERSDYTMRKRSGKTILPVGD
jgi:hypothetical protein